MKHLPCVYIISMKIKKSTAHSHLVYFNKVPSRHLPALTVNNRNSRTRCEICSKLTKIPERRQWRRLFLLLTMSISIVNFEHPIAGWVMYETLKFLER